MPEPRVGAVYVFNDRADGVVDRYIILDARRTGGTEWRLDLISVEGRHIYRDHRYHEDVKNVLIEDTQGDDEARLFLQAYLAPETVKGVPSDDA